MNEQNAVSITDESSTLTPDQWNHIRTLPSRHQSTVVKIVPMTVTPHLELLSCGHAGKMHDADVKRPEYFIGESRECLTCKWSQKEQSHE